MKKKKCKEIESDSIVLKPQANHINVEIQEIKAYGGQNWRGGRPMEEEQFKRLFWGNLEKAMNQLGKSIEAFVNIFSFLTSDELEKIKIVPRVMFPYLSKSIPELLCQSCSEVVQFKEDFDQPLPVSMFSPFILSIIASSNFSILSFKTLCSFFFFF